MGQQRLQDAAKLFARALALDPRLETARLNRAIALYNLQRFDAARLILLDFVKRHPDGARAWYNLGLVYKSTGQGQQALEAFRHAAQLEPTDADTHYFIGATASQIRRENEAIEALRRALELNHFHASAEFALARAYQRLGNQEESRKHLARFQQLTQSKLGTPMSLAYGDQGPLSLAEQVRVAKAEVEPAIKVTFASVAGQSGIAAPPAEAAAAGACFLDFDNDGLVDLFVGTGALYRNVSGGKFADHTEESRLTHFPATLCAAGDFDNDGHTDLAIAFSGRVVLYRNEPNGTFKDITANAGISGELAITGLTWVDFDHDGDVDLYVSAASGAGKNVLWRNNGNSTFTNWTAETALNGASLGSITAVPTDYNNDRAIDVLVTGATTQLFVNPREGKWTAAHTLPSSSVGAAVADFDKDGWMDIALTLNSAPGIELLRNAAGKELSPVRLPDLHWARAWGVAVFDYDNDGWIDVAALGEIGDGRGELRLLRNEGPHGFHDVTVAVKLDQIQFRDPRQVTAADYDHDGDIDLVVVESKSILLLRNDGGHQNRAVRLALKGQADNKSAIGTKVEIFAGDLYQKIEVTGAGYLGQSTTDILAGIGKRRQADVVRLLWPTGVVQDEIEIAAGKTNRILEIDRRGSSCPLLFAWDGTRYRFIADMLGAGVLGHWTAPGTRNVPDPTEYVKLEGVAPRVRNGRLSFRLMEPMEEVVYLDQVRLLAVDRPADTEVFPNEYFASSPPFAEFKVVASRGAKPVTAWDDSGRDVSALLRSRDRRYVDDMQLLRFPGFGRPHTLELDLGEPYITGPLRLLMHGYIEYFTATSMYAAQQAGLEPVAPYVEALDQSGRWARVLDDMGFPAGLLRTITVDLSGKMPPGARRLRITTNLQIYWDQVLVDRTPDVQALTTAASDDKATVRVLEVPLAEATLRFHGYPRAVEGRSPGDLTYIYELVSSTGPYSRQVGAYTRRGDVRDLVSHADDRFAIFGSGEEVALEFDPATLPPVAAGWKRDYFFFADGYEKDMDFYAADFLTVGPLPWHAMGVYPPSQGRGEDEAQRQYELEYNTRFVTSATPRSYRFHYPRSE